MNPLPTGFRPWVIAIPGWGRVAGVEWSGREPGSAPPLLLLHGFTGASDAWGSFLLQGLASRSPGSILIPDLPGHGGSPLPADPSRLTVPRVARLLAREVLPRLGAERAVWLGYSLGGRLALAAGVLHPGQVAGLVLESASPGLADPRARTNRRQEDEALARSLETEGMGPFVERWLARPLFRGLARLPEGEQEQERERRLRNDPRALAAVLRGLGTGSQPSLHSRLHEVRAPALLMAGGEDAKFAAIAREMAASLAAAQVEVFPGVGHAPHREAPEAWLHRVVRFVEGLR